MDRWITGLAVFLLSFGPLLGCQSLPQRSERSQASVVVGAPDYPSVFEKTRDTYLIPSDPTMEKRVRQTIPESKLIDYLQKNPSEVDADRAELIRAIEEETKNDSDPTQHVRLLPPPGQSGYTDLQIFVSHPYLLESKKVPASNLISVWQNFIRGAKHELVLNVFDFDLEEIALELIRASKRGISIRLGIDKGTIERRSEVLKIFQQLKDNGVDVIAVDSVSLNHQKVAARDWRDPQLAHVLFSSGNLTQSCLAPEGDLRHLPSNIRPRLSQPNANHIITLKSWVAANLVQHELTKTLDPSQRFRGANYPISGSFQITGPGVNPATLDPYPEPSLLLSFTPGGGFRNINKNILAHLLRNQSGPVRMIQFAFSSETVAQALLERAISDFQNKGDFDFLSVGDTPFALAPWSQFLAMSGLTAVEDPATGRRTFRELPENPWIRSLDPRNLKSLRNKVRRAPRIYGNHRIQVNGTDYEVSSKIHHKILAVGPFVTLGTSFNFSENAEKNNEQILVFRDRRLQTVTEGMIRWLTKDKPQSVFDEARRRNKRPPPAGSETTPIGRDLVPEQTGL